MDMLKNYKATIWVNSKREKISACGVLNIREAKRRMDQQLKDRGINYVEIPIDKITEIKALRHILREV